MACAVTWKEHAGDLYVAKYTDALMRIPDKRWLKEDRRLVKKEKGHFVADVDADGNHADTFDSGKLAGLALQGRGRAEAAGAAVGASGSGANRYAGLKQPPAAPRTTTTITEITMLKDLSSLLFGAFTARAPKMFPKGMAPVYHRPSQAGNYDVDVVQAAIAAAQSGDITPLLGLYRDMESADNVIQSAISTRKLAVMARGFSVVAADNSGDAGERVADEVKAMLDRSQSFVDACTWLLHGCVWPCSVVNIRWVPGSSGFSHPEFRLVPLELFDYRQRSLRIRDVAEDGVPLSTTHTPDEGRYIVHRGHMLMAPDTWGGPLRALVFWYLFSTQDREWWARFLERFGSPFLVGRYDKGDDESRLNLVNAFSEATRLFGIVATNETQVELKESASTSNSSTAFKDFHEVAKNEKLLLILGQTLSGNAENTGLGSGVAGLQGKVRDDVKLWDAFKLANTIKTAVVVPWMRANNIKGPAPSDHLWWIRSECACGDGNLPGVGQQGRARCGRRRFADDWPACGH
jgi:hypothetical protein